MFGHTIASFLPLHPSPKQHNLFVRPSLFIMKLHAAIVAFLAYSVSICSGFAPSSVVIRPLSSASASSSALFSTIPRPPVSSGPNDIVIPTATNIRIQGITLRTCPLDPDTESVQLSLTGPSNRPVVCEVQLWSAPTYVPLDIKVYLEEGNARPFNCVLKTPGSGNTVGIRNTSTYEYPATARIEPDAADMKRLLEMPQGDIIQGSALRSYPLDPRTKRVVIMLKSKPGTVCSKLHAYVGLLNGPNNIKQVRVVVV
jgi:hypothetical protein